jgi:general secretion pathway protein H
MTLRSDSLSASNSGFTLIEILVVLTILALTVGLVVPFLTGSITGTAQRAAVAEMRVALRGASVDAIEQGRTVVFRLDPRGGYWVDRRFHRLSLATNSASRLRITLAGGGRISFYPWGGSSGGRLRIEGPQGRREIAVDAVTGRAVPAR